MKCMAAITADLVRAPLGMRSRLGDELAGVPVIRRTVQRVLRAKRLNCVCIIAPADQHAALGDLLAGLNVTFFAQAGPPPYTNLVRAGRIWGLDGWRGGIGSLCCFDEDIDVISAASAALQHGADVVAMVPAAAPLFDPSMLDAMIDHYAAEARPFRFTFACAPPGLTGLVIAREMLDELGPTGQPPGAAMTYQPDRPFADLTAKEVCYRAPVELVEARGRLLADTHRSCQRLQDLFAAGAEDWPAQQIARWLIREGTSRAHDMPEEIEIELTTALSGGESSLLRPRPPEFALRGPIEMDAVQAVANQIGDFDDVRIVLGGFGDPCLHPQFPAICRILREARTAAIAVRTPARELPATAEAALFDTPVDVIEVALDAATPQTYARVHGIDAFAAVVAKLDHWIQRRPSQRQVLPLIVPSFVKSRDNLDDMEAFFDHWHKRLGAALITGYSHCARQRPERVVTATAPAPRQCCRRSFSRTLILADGRMTTCDQDFAGKQAIGHVSQSPLRTLWRNAPQLEVLRRQVVAELPLCAACEEWHRP